MLQPKLQHLQDRLRSIKVAAVDLNDKAIRIDTRINVIKQAIVDGQKTLNSLDSRKATTQKSAGVFQTLADKEQNRFYNQLTNLVTVGLQTVFECDMKFIIECDIERNNVVTDFYVSSIVEGTEVKFDIVKAKGGGVADIVSFLLQFLMVYYMENRRKIMILDEPWKNLSAEYRARFVNFVVSLCNRVGMQIIMVTHDEEFINACDTAYHFSKNADGATVISKIK